MLAFLDGCARIRPEAGSWSSTARCRADASPRTTPANDDGKHPVYGASARFILSLAHPIAELDDTHQWTEWHRGQDLRLGLVLGLGQVELPLSAPDRGLRLRLLLTICIIVASLPANALQPLPLPFRDTRFQV